MSTIEEAKDYLINNRLWDEDHFICAMRIAQNICNEYELGTNTYDAVKHGRRAITALCKVYANPPKVYANPPKEIK